MHGGSGKHDKKTTLGKVSQRMEEKRKAVSLSIFNKKRRRLNEHLPKELTNLVSRNIIRNKKTLRFSARIVG